MEEFEISVSDDIKERNLRLKALGNQWYEIYDESGKLAGEIKIDEKNHDHCETRGCTLDLPILSSIRKNIFLHKMFAEN
ncbi:hypothetical protein [Pedobacter sp. JY14-1]|uniref:hypothetical protein n=1 Tax=Pedobacter sp. JY14-1 TaxID=3034151 RepID=UPI0023E185D3|nr:hypothetical protein [Pedobacter sp. JY14-1]